ncbi:MAG: ABC transporter substrate-binding protein [Oscillospiraceae bacterium]|nr:ABC transporter substrate-binding protein [Oscillospiraceae bacterium]
MKRILCILLCLVLILSMFAACGAKETSTSGTTQQPAAAGASTASAPAAEPSEPAADKVFKIGVMCPASGDLAFVGEGTKRVVEYMQTFFEEAGGINGIPVEFIFEDDLGSAAGATTAIKKLIDVDGVNAIVGPYFTSCVLAVTPTLIENEVISISPTASPADAFSEDGYFFSLDQPPINTTKFQCAFLESKGYTRLAILGTYNDHTLDKIEQFNAVFPERGGEIVACETFQSGADNYRTELTKIKAANPDALFVNVSDQEFVKVVREMEELGMDSTIPIFASHELATDYVYKEVGDKLEGRFYCELPVPPAGTAEDELVKKFNENYAAWYKEQCGDDPTSDQSIAFDCALLLITAARQADSLSGPDLRAALRALDDVEGVTGRFTFNPDGSVDRTSYMMQFINGEMVYLDFAI